MPVICTGKVTGTATEGVKDKLNEEKQQATVCLSIREDLKSIVYVAHIPSEARKLLQSVFEPVSRARKTRLKRNFMNVSMSKYFNKIAQDATEVEQAGK